VQEEPDGPHLASGFAVILFTDIADSVRLTEELGDWVFHDRARGLRTALHALIRDFSGRVVEGITLGDGVMAEFGSAERAVGCGVSCSQHASALGLPLHIGVHAGDVIRDGGDVFGGAVNLAARICAEAPAGEVFVSQTIRDIARTSSPAQFASVGPRMLKGIADPVPLYSVQPSS
jgi:class 3 adenylate cyclase